MLTHTRKNWVVFIDVNLLDLDETSSVAFNSGSKIKLAISLLLFGCDRLRQNLRKRLARGEKLWYSKTLLFASISKWIIAMLWKSYLSSTYVKFWVGYCKVLDVEHNLLSDINGTYLKSILPYFTQSKALTTQILRKNSNRHKCVELWAKWFWGISDAISCARHPEKSWQHVRACVAGGPFHG